MLNLNINDFTIGSVWHCSSHYPFRVIDVTGNLIHGKYVTWGINVWTMRIEDYQKHLNNNPNRILTQLFTCEKCTEFCRQQCFYG